MTVCGCTELLAVGLSCVVRATLVAVLPLLVWGLVLMSGHGNLGYGEPLHCPVINYAILSPCDIFIAHLYLIRGQVGGTDVDIVLMAIYSESYVI